MCWVGPGVWMLQLYNLSQCLQNSRLSWPPPAPPNPPAPGPSSWPPLEHVLNQFSHLPPNPAKLECGKKGLYYSLYLPRHKHAASGAVAAVLVFEFLIGFCPQSIFCLFYHLLPRLRASPRPAVVILLFFHVHETRVKF